MERKNLKRREASIQTGAGTELCFLLVTSRKAKKAVHMRRGVSSADCLYCETPAEIAAFTGPECVCSHIDRAVRSTDACLESENIDVIWPGLGVCMCSWPKETSITFFTTAKASGASQEPFLNEPQDPSGFPKLANWILLKLLLPWHDSSRMLPSTTLAHTVPMVTVWRLTWEGSPPTSSNKIRVLGPLVVKDLGTWYLLEAQLWV